MGNSNSNRAGMSMGGPEVPPPPPSAPYAGPIPYGLPRRTFNVEQGALFGQWMGSQEPRYKANALRACGSTAHPAVAALGSSDIPVFGRVNCDALGFMPTPTQQQRTAARLSATNELAAGDVFEDSFGKYKT